MSKAVIFWPYIPKFFFRLYRPKNCFLALKNLFFRPKKNFSLFDLKISLNPPKTLRKHLFSLQIDEKNYFFRLYSKKLPYSSHIVHTHNYS